MDMATRLKLAELIQKDMDQLRQKADDQGVTAWMQRPVQRGRPNERFLQHTLRSVHAHNRRADEEEMGRGGVGSRMDVPGPYLPPPGEGNAELDNEDTAVVRRQALGPERPQWLQQQQEQQQRAEAAAERQRQQREREERKLLALAEELRGGRRSRQKEKKRRRSRGRSSDSGSSGSSSSGSDSESSKSSGSSAERRRRKEKKRRRKEKKRKRRKEKRAGKR
ncbi:hypothetical protein COHA_000386 [Chlorella ohadii]|uniref:Uncharacterized protein n=1 Tax=Chlorella ohadii TaxID=2649997 RepID=A0AAD5H9L3_9CHLO|nr:hypothetical protein COHA_000386 [Chlorella ohadii]